jgi:transposase InsO family protein
MVNYVFEDLRKEKATNTHAGMKNLHKLLKGEHILGLTNVHFEKDRICSACQAGKQAGVHHLHKNIIMTERPLELLHMDLFDPIAYISIGESKYCLVIMDDYSRFTWVFFLQEKSQTQETLKRFLRRAQNEFGLRIKKIRSDNRSVFLSLDFLRRKASSMSSLLPTNLNKMVLWRE